MPKALMHSFEQGRARSTARMIDKYSIIPIAACVYALIVYPLILVSCGTADVVCLYEPRPESRIVWPALAAISVVLAMRNHSRIAFPAHILWLFAYLALAGASVLWAFNPELSFIRFAQQVMIVSSIILPAMLAARTADLMRGLFLCFAVAAILNLLFILFGRPPIDVKFATWGYPGYFPGKNYLGEFATAAILLSVHEMLYPGLRRTSGIIVVVIATALLILSNSKTSMGLAVLAPALAALALKIKRKTGTSPAILLLSIPICFAAFSALSGFSIYRLSNILYGDPTFTGRSIIWDFANSEIARSPLFGWGYQSFWLVGPGSPSIVDAPGWVKYMPNAHNGYLDTILETGYFGFALLIGFIAATLHAIGRVADREPARAWIVLSLALHVIITNGLESVWLRGFEMLWVVFVILAAEIARYRQLSPPIGKVYGPRSPRPTSPGPTNPGPRSPAPAGLGGARRSPPTRAAA
jgi:exopolysaccharide production protein ExoQ